MASRRSVWLTALADLCKSEAAGALTPAALREATAAAGRAEAWAAADWGGWTPLHLLCMNSLMSTELPSPNELPSLVKPELPSSW